MTTSSYESLSHSKWDGKYHVVFIPKGRKKALYGKIRGFLGPVLRELAKPCHDFLYISGAFRRLYPVGTNAKSISC